MDEHEQRSRADAAQDADATQFVTLDSLPGHGPRRGGLLLAVTLGVLVALALVAAIAYTHRGRPAPARAEARP